MTQMLDDLGLRHGLRAAKYPMALAVVLAIGVMGFGLGAGCKKAPKKDQNKSAASGPSNSMDEKEVGTVAKDGKKKPAVGMNVTLKRGVGGAYPARPPAGGVGTAPPTTPATGQPRPATGPVKVQLVVGLNATKLRKTFLWKQLMSVKMVQTLMAGKTYGQLKTALGKDPLQLIDSARVVIGGASLNAIKKPEHLALSVSGRFDAGATLKKLMTIPMKPGAAKPVLTKINGKDAIRGKGKKGDGFALVAVNKNTIAMCSDSMLHIVTKGDLTGGNAAIGSQLKALDAKSLAWIVFGGVQIPLGQASAMPGMAALKSLKGGSVVLDNGKTQWKVVNRLDVGTPKAAKSLLQLVSMMKMALGKGGPRAGGAPPGLGAILKHLVVTTNGATVIATLALPEAAVKKLFNTLLKKL